MDSARCSTVYVSFNSHHNQQWGDVMLVIQMKKPGSGEFQLLSQSLSGRKETDQINKC